MTCIDHELFRLRLIGTAAAILNIGLTLALPFTPQLVAVQFGTYLCLYAGSRRLDEIEGFLEKVNKDLVSALRMYLGNGVAACGPKAGFYRGCPVFAWVDLPERGGRFTFEGAAPREADGSVELSRLRDDQVLLYPGVLYRRAGA